MKRIVAIDSIRGLANLLMIYANFAPYMLGEDPPFIFRVFSSLAAPLFIFTAGYSTMLGASDSKRKTYASLLILVTAVLVDMLIWGIMPFQTFDVLYAIAISLVLISLLPVKGNGWLFISLGLFSVSFLARYLIGYRFTMSEHFIWDGLGQGFLQISQIDPIIRLFIDGWFPLLPWMGFAFLGRYFSETGGFAVLKNTPLRWALPVFFTGALLAMQFTPIQPLRDGYVELFYPPSFPYLLLAVSWVGMAFLWFPADGRNALLGVCTALGRKSLFVYLFHSVIAHFILDQFVLEYSMSVFLAITSMAILAIYLVAASLNHLEAQGHLKRIPWAFRKVLGI